MAIDLPVKGGSVVVGPDEGQSNWMPDPGRGYTATIFSPRNCPSVQFSCGTQRMEQGEVLPEHHHPRHEELFFFLSGTGTMRLAGEPHAVTPGTAVFAGRNVTHTCVAESPEPLEWLWLLLPPGLEDVLDGVGAPRRPGEPRPAQVLRPDPVPPLVRFTTVSGPAPREPAAVRAGESAMSYAPAVASRSGEAIVVPPGQGISHWMPDPSEGFTVIALSPLTHSITGFSLGTQRLEPGERLPEHHHPRHDELFFIWSGEGTAHLDGAAHRLAPGTALFAGRNVAHTFLNEGDTPLVFIWVFFPDGLEYVLDALGTRREPGTPRPVPCPRPTTPHPISSQITVRGLRG